MENHVLTKVAASEEIPKKQNFKLASESCLRGKFYFCFKCEI